LGEDFELLSIRFAGGDDACALDDGADVEASLSEVSLMWYVRAIN